MAGKRWWLSSAKELIKALVSMLLAKFNIHLSSGLPQLETELWLYIVAFAEPVVRPRAGLFAGAGGIPTLNCSIVQLGDFLCQRCGDAISPRHGSTVPVPRPLVGGVSVIGKTVPLR